MALTMGWQDQGRQEHGWFGHGRRLPLPSDHIEVAKDELRARAKAAFDFAMETIRPMPGSAAIPYWPASRLLGALVPYWSDGATARPDVFRTTYLGQNVDPVDAWAMQQAVLAIQEADTHAMLQHAGADMCHAILTIGIPSFLSFLDGVREQTDKATQAANAPVKLVSMSEESKEEEDDDDKRLLPKPPISMPHVPSSEDPGLGSAGPKIGGAAPPSIVREPEIVRQKQDGHNPGTPQYINRMRNPAKSTSTFDVSIPEGDRLTRQAWAKGRPHPTRPNVRDHDFGFRVGTGPNGGGQTSIRAHQNAKGDIHGHPAGPETTK